MPDIYLTIMMGLWIVSIATVPVYYWVRAWKRSNCVHEYINIRICDKCGKREKAIAPITKIEEVI